MLYIIVLILLQGYVDDIIFQGNTSAIQACATTDDTVPFVCITISLSFSINCPPSTSIQTQVGSSPNFQELGLAHEIKLDPIKSKVFFK